MHRPEGQAKARRGRQAREKNKSSASQDAEEHVCMRPSAGRWLVKEQKKRRLPHVKAYFQTSHGSTVLPLGWLVNDVLFLRCVVRGRSYSVPVKRITKKTSEIPISAYNSISLSPKVPINLINAMGSIINKSHFEAKVNLDGGSRVSISASRTKGVLRNNGSTFKKSCQRYLPSLFGYLR